MDAFLAATSDFPDENFLDEGAKHDVPEADSGVGGPVTRENVGLLQARNVV